MIDKKTTSIQIIKPEYKGNRFELSRADRQKNSVFGRYYMILSVPNPDKLDYDNIEALNLIKPFITEEFFNELTNNFDEDEGIEDVRIGESEWSYRDNGVC